MLTLPIIDAARRRLNAREVAVIAAAESAQLAAGRSCVDRVFCPERLGLYRLFCRDLELDPGLQDLLGVARWVLNLLTGPDGGVHQRLTEAAGGELVSIDPRPTQATREHRTHITRQWTAELRRAGWDVPEPTFTPIHLSRPTPRHVPFVMLHPGSGGRDKCWPLERFVALAEALDMVDVAWMVGPAETEVARVLQDRPEPVLFEPQLLDAAKQLAACDLYIGNDSGMTHIAAAIGLPTIAIFATTDPRIWRPLGEHVTVVAPDKPAESMEAVAFDGVLQAVKSRLNHDRTG